MVRVRRLNREGLIQVVSTLFSPAPNSEREGNEMLITFAANCPDPVSAMKVFLDADEESAAEVVDKALAMPPRSVSTYSARQLHPNHPLRHVEFEK